jgi:hypothetical protein
MKSFTVVLLVSLCCSFATAASVASSRQAEIARGVSDLLNQFIQQSIMPSVTQATQTLAELLAQITAGVAINGLPGLQDLMGKRSADEVTMFKQQLTKGWLESLTQIVSGPITQALQTTAELAAQATAAIAVGGIPALQALFG